MLKDFIGFQDKAEKLKALIKQNKIGGEGGSQITIISN